MKLHAAYGFEILHGCGGLERLAHIVLHHHERFDGTGYPNGLGGNDIPPESRIIAIADAFDAMTTFRTYRRPVPFEAALEAIAEGSGSQFDPEMAACFLDISKVAEEG